MQINASIILACMVLSAGLETASALPASSSTGSEILFRARGIHRRETSYMESAAPRITFQKRQMTPSSLMTSLIIDKVSVSIAATISKFSEAKEAGAELPTLEEMKKTIGDALKNSDPDNKAEASRAIETALNALADHKLAEAKSGGSKLSTRQSKDVTASDEMITKIATNHLDTITKFVNAKHEGGQLPTSSEISSALTEALKNVEVGKPTKSAEAFKSSLDSLAEKKMTEATQKTQGQSRGN